MTDYEALEILPGATAKEVHRAYVEQVKKYHPDKYKSLESQKEAQEKLKRINLAYQRLKSVMPTKPCPPIKYKNKIYTVSEEGDFVTL